MPKEGAMTQISRPFQIALAAIVLLAAVWFVALRGHSSGGNSTGSTPAVSTPAPSTNARSTSATHASSTPSAAGLTRAIAKAQSVVARDERDAKQLQRKAAATRTTHASRPAAKPHAVAHPQSAASSTSKQTLVEGELKHGQTVIVLFWNPQSTVDVAAHRQLELLQALHAKPRLSQDKDIAVHYSAAGEVGQYGTITGSLQVLQTPTMLVIAPNGKTKTLSGLIDAYAIQQAIKEARQS
jgi:hypothetical protein